MRGPFQAWSSEYTRSGLVRRAPPAVARDLHVGTALLNGPRPALSKVYLIPRNLRRLHAHAVGEQNGRPGHKRSPCSRVLKCWRLDNGVSGTGGNASQWRTASAGTRPRSQRRRPRSPADFFRRQMLPCRGVLRTLGKSPILHRRFQRPPSTGHGFRLTEQSGTLRESIHNRDKAYTLLLENE